MKNEYFSVFAKSFSKRIDEFEEKKVYCFGSGGFGGNLFCNQMLRSFYIYRTKIVVFSEDLGF